MTLIYACIAPHATDLIPETPQDQNRVTRTRQAMELMGRHLEALQPEVVVIVNPHGFRVQTAMSVAIAERAIVDWSSSIKLEFDLDTELANQIADTAAQMNVPVVRYIYGSSSGPDCSIPLDWGAAVPLYFLGHNFCSRPKIVPISPMRLLPYQTHYDFGRAIARAVREPAARVALVASADQGHAHAAEGPYGFDRASARYDAWMQEIVAANRLPDLLTADPILVENGKPDSLWPTLVLAGALAEKPMHSRILSYEVNVYFGMLCAEFVSS